MRSRALITLALCLFVAVVAAWSKEDHEIFKLRDEVIAHDGANVTFYSLLGVTPSATQDQLNKAWRKKSREEHPDKAQARFVANYAKTHAKKSKTKGVKVSKQPSKREIDAYVKDQTKHYQRLSVIADILRGPQRERYDHFLKNGFPTWRGTGYYYQRFRPGTGSVLVGLAVAFLGLGHYVALVVNYRERQKFVERYIRHARRLAFGDESGISGISGIPGVSGTSTPVPEQKNDSDEAEGMDMQTLNRKQKRQMEKENRLNKGKKAVKNVRKSGISTPVEAELTSGPVGAKKRVVAQNGKVLIVDSSGNVFLEEETEEGMKQEFLLDPNEEPYPRITDTLLFKLPKYLYNQSIGRLTNPTNPSLEEPLLESSSDLPEDEAAIRSATAINANAEARKRKINIKGGR